MPLPVDYSFVNDESLRCKGAQNTDKAENEGEYFGNILVNNRVWAIVLWDGDEDPVLRKADLTLIEAKTWMPIRD